MLPRNERSAERIDDEHEAQGLRRLAELPALTIDSAADVRGWEVLGADGQPVGRVSDLLVDVDRLSVKYVVVASGDEGTPAGREEAVLAVTALTASRDDRRLRPGHGLPPIRVRYQSTTYLVWWALGAVLLVLLMWAMGVFIG